MTVRELMESFAETRRVSILTADRGLVEGIIESIEREDGSGLCYNLKLYGVATPVFCRCKPQHAVLF